MSLRTKFTLSISFIILFIILGISESIFLAQKSLLTNQLEENRNKVFRDFKDACYESLVVKDEIQIFNIIKSMIRTHNPAIVYAGYISPLNTVFYVSRDADQAEALKKRIVPLEREIQSEFVSGIGEKVKEYGYPIYFFNEYRGSILLGYSQRYLELQIKDGLDILGREIQRVAIVSLLIGIILANILAYYIIKPIRKLAAAADDIGGGNLDVQVNINRKDEIGKLGKTFNHMARKLKELDELKDGFVSSVSHELRSPLAAIDGYCDYMIDGIARNMPPEKQEKSLKIIKEATIRLTNFINNILDLAKIKAGRFELRRMPVPVHELSQEIVALFESLAAQQKKTLSYHAEGAIPSVDGDPEKVKQVITNLIGNALKFTPENAAITVSARVEGAMVEMWVADTGIGIPPEALNKVFDKFYQVKESEMKKPKGTGLGLAIVAEIIKLHGGRIWVESTMGKGSTFKFTLPVWKPSV